MPEKQRFGYGDKSLDHLDFAATLKALFWAGNLLTGIKDIEGDIWIFEDVLTVFRVGISDDIRFIWSSTP